MLISPTVLYSHTKTLMSNLEFSGVYLTVEEHGCVYTVCTEGELFWAPIYHDGTVNLEAVSYTHLTLPTNREV